MCRIHRLARLDLSDNMITALPAEWFDGKSSPDLEALELHGNAISELPANFFSALQSLEELDLGNNELHVLPPSISQASRLAALFVGGNQLTELPQVVCQIDALGVIDVSHNRIRMLPDFSLSKRLQVLNASYNPLALAPLVLPETMTELYLDCCTLREFHPLKLPRLECLMLAGNNLSTVDLSGFPVQTMKLIDLSYNQLRDLPAPLLGLLAEAAAAGAEVKCKGNMFISPGRSDALLNIPAFEPRFMVGVSELRGRADIMECSLCAMGDLLGDRSSDLIAMFDGQNCDATVVNMAAMRVGKTIAEKLGRANAKECIFEALHEADALFTETDGKPRGSTALVALFTETGKKLHVANLGDTKALLCHDEEFVRLTTDHRPLDQAEYLRITDAAGFVTKDGDVQGQVRTSRGLGFWGLRPAVSDEPSYVEYTIEEEDEFVLFANDGVWSKVSEDIAVAVVREALTSTSNAHVAAMALRDVAFVNESAGNIVVAVVLLPRTLRQRVQKKPQQLGPESLRRSAILRVQTGRREQVQRHLHKHS